jgi:RNA polymerase sigma-B factor
MTAAASVPAVEAEYDEYDEYACLVPLHRRYVELAPDDRERKRLRGQLIGGYLPVAENIARRFAGRGEPLNDLIQVATIGLINAVDRFEPARGSHFLSFAVPTITGEVRRYFRDHGWSMRVPRQLKDLHVAIRAATGELSQQLGRAPRPSELADRLGYRPRRCSKRCKPGTPTEARRWMSCSAPVILRGLQTRSSAA